MEMDSRSGFCFQPVPLSAEEFASPGLVSSQHTVASVTLGSRSGFSPAPVHSCKPSRADRKWIRIRVLLPSWCCGPDPQRTSGAEPTLLSRDLDLQPPPPSPLSSQRRVRQLDPDPTHTAPGLHAPWRSRSGISFQPMYYPPAWSPAPGRPTRLLDLLGWSPFPIGLQLQAFLQRTNTSGLSINFLNSYD